MKLEKNLIFWYEEAWLRKQTKLKKKNQKQDYFFKKIILVSRTSKEKLLLKLHSKCSMSLILKADEEIIRPGRDKRRETVF